MDVFFAVIRFCGYTVIRFAVIRFAVIRLYDFAVLRFCGFAVLRLYGFAEVTNNFHIPPQNRITAKPYNLKPKSVIRTLNEWDVTKSVKLARKG